ILSPWQLKRLSEHKYSASGTSLFEPIMQIFWRWLVEHVPLWWAPNAITIVGLLVNILTTLILAYYSPDCKQEISTTSIIIIIIIIKFYYYYYFFIILHCVILLSHLPSSLGTVILGASIVLQLGTVPGWLLAENLASYFLFYCAHWQTYVCGTLKFGKLDVTEGQIVVILVCMLTAVFGPGIWTYELPVLHIQFKLVPVYAMFFGAILMLKEAFHVIFMQGGVGKNGSTVAGTSTIFPVFPIMSVVVLAVIIQQKSPSMVFENHPCVYLLAFGLLSAKITNRLVVAHMTKSEMDLWDTGLIGPAALFLNQYFNCWLDEHLVLWFCLIWVLFDLLRYSTVVCQEICEHLRIYCFVITSRPPQAKESKDSSNNGASS
ncbi:hypothetical protein EGW08_011881, partial [Elysia chlorotica]